MPKQKYKNVKKLRSRFYDLILEVVAPIRFYWDKDEFDGIEIGEFVDGLSRTEKKHFEVILNTIGIGIQAKQIIDFIKEKYPEILSKIIKEMEEESDIPKPFLDAFKE